jgi:hypothetical protein
VKKALGWLFMILGWAFAILCILAIIGEFLHRPFLRTLLSAAVLALFAFGGIKLSGVGRDMADRPSRFER